MNLGATALVGIGLVIGGATMFGGRVLGGIVAFLVGICLVYGAVSKRVDEENRGSEG